MKVLHIPAVENKPFALVDIGNKGDTLKEMQDLVGGYIEVVPLPTEEIELYVNEEGLLEELPPNIRASKLIHLLWQVPTVVIVGDVFLTGPVNGEGDATDVPDYIVEAMKKAANESQSPD